MTWIETGIELNEDTSPAEDPPDEFLFVWACGFELAIGLVGLTIAWVVGFDARAYIDRIDEIAWRSIAIQSGIGVLAAIPMLIVIALLMKIPHESISAIKRLSENPTMKVLLSLSRAELLMLSICAGIGEELAFRGCLLPWLTALQDPTATTINPFTVGDSFQLANPSLLATAVLFSSIAFGMLHPITKLYVLVATLMGIYFAMLLVVTDSLLVPIVAHAAYDAVQFLMAKREEEAEQAQTATE
ncbi:CPBP family intramembrane metalloprotease [Stieleria sp. TO1_6]|uniref:CPBP family intramembrane glutamic endopeptidase n=1 Tax=Stieleria tagensis TaxID=2956795 RepID=UPI00209B85C5|nr:CPBP family intramembrane glutamic endopeptidase [Stieleria tagensis]MCO8122066.1 CPBP family intramembrane metalloprotease [Stieleria tagensis]